MSDLILTPTEPEKAAYERGRRVGLASAALAMSVVAHFNLLNLEKSLLAIVLAVMAIKGARAPSVAIRRSRIALIIASVHILAFFVVLWMIHDKIIPFFQLLRPVLDQLNKLS